MSFIEGAGQYEIVDTDMVVRDSQSGGSETMYSQEQYTGLGESQGDMSQNKVTIDVKSDRAFRSDSVNFIFAKNVVRPTRIRIVSVRPDGSEQILLPEKFFTRDSVNFPEANTNHFRITFHYIKPLRISEIVFAEKGIPTTTENFVRFIAQPQMGYEIYYNTTSFVKTPSVESPNWTIGTTVKTIESKSKYNPLYKKADTDGDGVIDSVDNCVSIVNANQVDKDDNGIGDACEDFDHDGVLNAQDNCSDMANRNQADEDKDGIGDVCDGVESRFMEKYPWISYVVLGVVFAIVVTLIVKTLKDK